jgi:hypothetical protein
MFGSLPVMRAASRCRYATAIVEVAYLEEAMDPLVLVSEVTYAIRSEIRSEQIGSDPRIR